MDHIDFMETLRREIGLRAYGNHDPIIEYKKESGEIFERMVYLSAYGSVKLPFVSNSNYGGVGVMDISDFTITFATYQLLVTSSVLDYDDSEDPVISSVTELNSVGWEVVCCMPYETGESVYIYFEVRDDLYEYHDTMYVKKMIYVSADNIEIEKNLKL